MKISILNKQLNSYSIRGFSFPDNSANKLRFGRSDGWRIRIVSSFLVFTHIQRIQITAHKIFQFSDTNLMMVMTSPQCGISTLVCSDYGYFLEPTASFFQEQSKNEISQQNNLIYNVYKVSSHCFPAFLFLECCRCVGILDPRICLLLSNSITSSSESRYNHIFRSFDLVSISNISN